jgi:hypothetical protein
MHNNDLSAFAGLILLFGPIGALARMIQGLQLPTTGRGRKAHILLNCNR